MNYLRKHGGMLTRMTEGVNVPSNTRATTRPKCVIEEPQTQSHLVDHSTVVGGRLVAHTPTAIHKLQAAWRPGVGWGGVVVSQVMNKAHTKKMRLKAWNKDVYGL